MKKYLIKALIFLFLFATLCTNSYPTVSKNSEVYKFEKLNERLKEYVENPNKYEKGMKVLIEKFFTGPGLRITVAICLFVSLVFFFRTRNYVFAIIFYVLANFIMFFGPKIFKFIFRL